MDFIPTHSVFIIVDSTIYDWEYLNYSTPPSIKNMGYDSECPNYCAPPSMMLYNVSPTAAETLRSLGVTLYKDERSIRDIVPARVLTTEHPEDRYYDLPQFGFSEPVRCATFAPYNSLAIFSSPALLEVVSYETDEGVPLDTKHVYVHGLLPDIADSLSGSIETRVSAPTSTTITKE